MPASATTPGACPKCSLPLRADANHCYHCGTTLRGLLRYRRLAGQLAAIAITAVVFGLGGWLISSDDTQLRRRVGTLQAELARVDIEAQQAHKHAAEAHRRYADAERRAADATNGYAAANAQAVQFSEANRLLVAEKAKLVADVQQLGERLTAAESRATAAEAKVKTAADATSGVGQIVSALDLINSRQSATPTQPPAADDTARQLKAALTRADEAEVVAKQLATELAALKSAKPASPAVPQPKRWVPVGNNPDPGEPGNWRMISDALSRNQRVTQDQVRAVLGPPASINRYDALKKVVWGYPRGGQITLSLDGNVLELQAPRW